MKIILTYPDLGKEAEAEIVDWIHQIIKNPVKPSPLKYVKNVEVQLDLITMVKEEET